MSKALECIMYIYLKNGVRRVKIEALQCVRPKVIFMTIRAIINNRFEDVMDALSTSCRCVCGTLYACRKSEASRTSLDGTIGNKILIGSEVEL